MLVEGIGILGLIHVQYRDIHTKTRNCFALGLICITKDTNLFVLRNDDEKYLLTYRLEKSKGIQRTYRR